MSKKSINKLVFAALVATAIPAAPSLADDKSFLDEAMKGDNAEVALGRLAERKGASEEVRHFGRQLAADHAKAKKQVVAVARKLKIPDTDAIPDEAIEEKTKLGKLSGTDFDKEFAAYMVKDHEEDIQKFEKEANEGTGKVAELAKETLPKLREHLKTAQSLQK